MAHKRNAGSIVLMIIAALILPAFMTYGAGAVQEEIVQSEAAKDEAFQSGAVQEEIIQSEAAKDEAFQSWSRTGRDRTE